MPTLTVENYVKAIYLISGGRDSVTVGTGEVARKLSVSPGSVTSMLRTLSDSGLADYQAYEGVKLTAAGRKLALLMLRRHRLMELFLVRTLGLTWDEVHEEAENLEHSVSDTLVDRIDAFLGYPERDPHGDPIPTSDGSLAEVNDSLLIDCPTASCFALQRVVDQSAEFLRYLGKFGLTIGAKGTVVENHTLGGAVVVAVNGQQVSLGTEAARKLEVRILPD